jgi:transposase
MRKIYPTDLSDEEWARLRYVTPADVQDRVGAHLLFAGLNLFVPHLKKIWASGAYDGKALERWLEQRSGWEPDYERRVQASETLIEMATIRLLVRRLARSASTLPNTL